MSVILQIAIPTPLRKTFDYLAPDAHYEMGARVRVPFGKRQLIGVIVGIKKTSDYPVEKLKKIDTVLDEKPLLDASLLTLYQFTSDYYQHPIGDVIVGTLPKKIRDGMLIIITRKLIKC